MQVLGGLTCAVEKDVLYEQLEIRLEVYKLVVRSAGRTAWCEADNSCRGRGEADIGGMQKGTKTELNGRGLSFSPDMQ